MLTHTAIETIIGKNYTLDPQDAESKFGLIAESKFGLIADSLEAQQQDDDEDQLDMFEGFITSFSLIAESKFRVKETLKRFADQLLIALQDRSDSFCRGLLAGLLFANNAIELSQEALINAMRQAYAVYERFKSQWLEMLNAKSINRINRNFSNTI